MKDRFTFGVMMFFLGCFVTIGVFAYVESKKGIDPGPSEYSAPY